MTIQRSDTAARAVGFDARLESGFAWLAVHWQVALIVIGSLLLAGVVAASVYELRKSAESEAQFALSRIDDTFFRSMGSDIEAVLVQEPANPDRARQSRVAALAGYDQMIADHPGSRAADIARLQAAQMETELGLWDEAAFRLLEMGQELAAADPLRATALRLRGFVLEQQGRWAEAGEAYEQAARVESYPVKGAAWIEAGAAYARGNEKGKAIAAMQQAINTDPELAEQTGILQELNALSSGP